MQDRQKSPPSVVVFDLGGVLFDWNPEHLYRKLIPDAEARRHFLTEICPRDWHVLQDGGSDPVAATASLQRRQPAYAGLIGAWYERFDEMLAPPPADMVDLVGRLQARGLGLHLLSNAPAFMHDWLVGGRLRQAYPFLAAFRQVVVSGAEGVSKPDRRIYDLTATRGGFVPAEAVFIDDAAANVDGARAAGWQAVHHISPQETIEALRALGLPA